jgi:hypothetical protein
MKSIDEYSQEEAEPILRELHKIGLNVRSVGELYNKRYAYKEAIPTLLYWLPRVTSLPLKDDIVRALSVKWAKPVAAVPLIHEFYAIKGDSNIAPLVKWAIGNALEVVADKKVLDDLIRIALDPSHGIARQMVVLALGNIQNPKSIETSMSLLDDREVVLHALLALSRLKATEALPKIEQLLNHPDAPVRKYARHAVKKLRKTAG